MGGGGARYDDDRSQSNDHFADVTRYSRQITGIFWIAVFFHAILWTLLPGLLHTAYRADVLEQLFTGREWVPASNRHPALPAILLELTNLVTGRAFLSPFLVSQFCMFLTVWAVWKLGRSLLTPFLALTASLSILSYHFFTIESIKYNHNIPYIAFWTLSLLFVHESIRTGKLVYWIAAGVTIGLDLNSKFSAALLVFSILIFFVFDSKAKKTWQTPGPYLTTVIAFIVFLPQIIWAVFKQKIPLPDYVAGPNPLSFFSHCFITIRFLFSQIGYLVLPLAILSTVVQIPLRKRTDLTPDQQWSRRFLTAMIFLPLIEHILFGLGYLQSINGEYGAPIWPVAGIWFLLFFQSGKEFPILLLPNEVKPAISFKRFGVAVLIIEILLVTVFVIQSCFSPYLLGVPRKFHFPMRSLGTACEKIWSEHVQTIPCPYTTGDDRVAGSAAEGMRPRPSVHSIQLEGNDHSTSWSTDADVNQRGGLILWDKNLYEKGEPKTLRTKFPNAVVLESLILPYENFANVPPVEIGVAIVLPTEHPPKQE